MARSIIYNKEAKKRPWSLWVGPPVYHTIIQKSILMH